MSTIDFSQPSDARNLALEIEERKLWVSRETLALYSPVFNTMFYGDFRESGQDAIKLPGKRYADMEELMLVLTPPILKPVDADNVDLMLDLAREYSIDKLKHRCNKYLRLSLENSSSSGDRHLDILILACKYEMVDLIEQCVPKVSQLPVSVIDSRQGELPAGVLAALYQAKLSKWRKHCRHDLSGSPAPASARPQYNNAGNMAVFGANNVPVVGPPPGTLSYFCTACNSTFSSIQQRLTCRFCRSTVCDDCARCRPCPKSLDHSDTCDCGCDYNPDLLRR